MLAGADDDAATEGGDAGPAEIPSLGQADGASGANSTEDGVNQIEALKNSTASNMEDDKVIDKTRFWANHHYGIKDINETDPIYGHKVFKD